MIDKFLSVYDNDLPWLRERTILLVMAGSHSYGTNTPTSDVDVRGVAVTPTRYLLGFQQGFEQAERKEPDIVVYALQKFMAQAAKGNPASLEQLFTEDRHRLLVTPAGERLLEHRELFLSRLSYDAFAGYAAQQIRRLESHRRWMRNPPGEPPKRADFGLPERTVIPKDQLSAARAVIARKVAEWDVDFPGLEGMVKIDLQNHITDALTEMQVGDRMIAAGRICGFSENFLELLAQEKRYESAKKDWDQYQQWKKNRNPERYAMEVKFGFDGKYGMHAMRLLRTATKLISTGKMTVFRDDAEELLGIRYGKWTIDKLLEEAEAEFQRAKDALPTSPLPKKPDYVKLNDLCVEIHAQMKGDFL